eukprot:scaffold14475_cov107-Isochrysis_galbana.AAC.4
MAAQRHHTPAQGAARRSLFLSLRGLTRQARGPEPRWPPRRRCGAAGRDTDPCPAHAGAVRPLPAPPRAAGRRPPRTLGGRPGRCRAWRLAGRRGNSAAAA